MTYKSIHPQFANSFEYFTSITDNIKESLWNYMAYGLPPGGLITAVLMNDFIDAIIRADAWQTCTSLRELAQWVDFYMPVYMRCSKESMDQWMAKTDEERRDIMISLKLRPHEFDILRGIASA